MPIVFPQGTCRRRRTQLGPRVAIDGRGHARHPVPQPGRTCRAEKHEKSI